LTVPAATPCSSAVISFCSRGRHLARQVIEKTVGGVLPEGTPRTLTDSGVGLAPYHQLAGKVPATLQKEITALEQGVAAGTVKVKSLLTPDAGRRRRRRRPPHAHPLPTHAGTGGRQWT